MTVCRREKCLLPSIGSLRLDFSSHLTCPYGERALHTAPLIALALLEIQSYRNRLGHNNMICTYHTHHTLIETGQKNGTLLVKRGEHDMKFIVYCARS